MENCDVRKSLIFTNQVEQAIDRLAQRLKPNAIFVLVDTNTASYVLPRLQSMSQAIGSAKIISVKAGEEHKNLDSLASIWQRLGDMGATRSSLLINIGGGVITDMGAFAASTFKRGIAFINIPTTLLGAVDASVGGKTGVNFNSLKNEIGVFSQAESVIISTTFFRTLPTSQLLSGYAEMLKHGYLSSPKMTSHLLNYDIQNYDPDTLLELLRESVEVKCHFVECDFMDCGLRHSLNLGHTFGHAFESLALRNGSPISHGSAVAFGMVVAMVLSRIKLDYPSADLQRYVQFVNQNYGAFAINCDDYPTLIESMHHDKKNMSTDSVLCVLLHKPGEPAIDIAVTDNEITTALDIYRDMLHLP